MNVIGGGVPVSSHTPNIAIYAIPNMAVEEGSGCTCTTDVVQFPMFGDPRSCEFELPTPGDVEWLLFSYT